MARPQNSTARIQSLSSKKAVISVRKANDYAGPSRPYGNVGPSRPYENARPSKQYGKEPNTVRKADGMLKFVKSRSWTFALLC